MPCPRRPTPSTRTALCEMRQRGRPAAWSVPVFSWAIGKEEVSSEGEVHIRTKSFWPCPGGAGASAPEGRPPPLVQKPPLHRGQGQRGPAALCACAPCAKLVRPSFLLHRTGRPGRVPFLLLTRP